MTKKTSKRTPHKAATPHLHAQPPKNFLTKPLKIDFKKFLKATVQGIGHATVGDFHHVASDTVDAVAALGITTEPGELASSLITRALMRAIFDLLVESGAEQLAELKGIDKDLDLTIVISDTSVDQRFLDRPGDAPFIEDVQSHLKAWLNGDGISDAASTAMVGRLPSYFVYALNQEWRRNASTYKPIIDAINTPFTQAGEREWSWLEYTAYLQKHVDASVFDEPFSLRQIYIPLNAFYYEDTKDTASNRAMRDEPRRRIVVSLHDELRDWLSKADDRDSLRVISGGPGSGKSSFARIFAARIAAEGAFKVLVLPLHLIDPDRDLEDEVSRFVQDEGVLRHNPLDRDDPEPKLLIIFDGLDELASQGKAAAETARHFVLEVEKTLDRRNRAPSSRLRVLISGREVVVQENEAGFRRPRQVLTLLPYVLPESQRDHNDARTREDDRATLDDPDGLLAEDLRDRWWQKYGVLTGAAHDGLPDELARDDLSEVTAQPLLNYLIAMSYTRGELDFSGELNLNSIYHDLVRAVHERAHEKGRGHTNTRDLSLDEFLLVLEEIGRATWHGDGRSTTEAEIEKYCRDGGLDRILEAFKEGAKTGVTRLLAAFFFRRHGRRATGDPTFVFTHKSFGEYLAARRIVRAMERVADARAERRERHDRGWDEQEALEHWIRITGPAPITKYLHPFLLNEVRLSPLERVTAWQHEFTSLFSDVLKHRAPVERVRLETFQQAAFQARNAEEALLVALNACARTTATVSQIVHPTPTAFSEWFRTVQGQYTGPERPSLAGACLSYLHLQETICYISDLYGADLSSSDLKGAKLAACCLWGAHLRDADLKHADLKHANLMHANLARADLMRANLEGANLHRANLVGANLEGANLHRANLVGARGLKRERQAE